MHFECDEKQYQRWPEGVTPAPQQFLADDEQLLKSKDGKKERGPNMPNQKAARIKRVDRQPASCLDEGNSGSIIIEWQLEEGGHPPLPQTLLPAAISPAFRRGKGPSPRPQPSKRAPGEGWSSGARSHGRCRGLRRAARCPVSSAAPWPLEKPSQDAQPPAAPGPPHLCPEGKRSCCSLSPEAERSRFLSREAEPLWFPLPGAKRSRFLSPEAKRSWFLSPGAKYHAPADIYCESVPKFKRRYTAVQGRSIDLDLPCVAAAELLKKKILTPQMKKQMSSWHGDEAGESPEPRDVSPLDGCISKADGRDVNTAGEDDLSQLSQRALSQDPQDNKARSTALETIWIEKNLQTGRMSEGLLGSQRGLTDCSDPKEGTLKSVVSRSPSQRLLLASKPVPPIQKRLPSSEPRRTRNGEQKQWRAGADGDDSDGKKKEVLSVPKAYKASQRTRCCSGGNEKMSLGMPLIPPIAKSARPSDEAPHSPAVFLPSSQHLVFQKSLQRRLRSGSRGEEKILKPLGLPREPILPVLQRHVGGGMRSERGFHEPVAPLRLPPIQAKGMDHEQQRLHTREPIVPVLQHHVGGGMKPDRKLYEPVAPLHLPPIQTKRMDHLTSPRLQSGDNSKDSNGRIDVTLSMSVQKINWQQMRVKELLCRERKKEREKSLQLLAQGIDPGDAAEETTPLPATALDSVECEEKSEHRGDQEARPFPDAQQGLLDTLTWLSSDDWKEKTKGLFSVRRLAICHSEVLLSRLHGVSLAVTKEVNNLRLKVSLLALNTLEELFRTMKKHMDPFVDEVIQILLQRLRNCSVSIQKAASRCLGTIVGSVTPARAMTALMASGIQHCNVLVRRCAAEHLLATMEQIGAQKLLSGKYYSTVALVRAVVKLAQDCHPDTRCYGQKMLSMLMSHQKFEKYLKQSVPSHDLRDVMAKIRQKGIEELKREAASAKESQVSMKSGQKMSQNNLPSDAGLQILTGKGLILFLFRSLRSGSGVPSLPCQRVHHPSVQAVEETEEFMKLYRLLTAEDFQSRLEGVQLLRDHCKSSPWFITTVSVQVFDFYVLRIQDGNKKVKQQALEALAWMTSMLRDALHPVLVSLAEAVTENLNSKHPVIYAAAVKALEAFISQLGLPTRKPIVPVLQHHVGGGMKPGRELREPVLQSQL
ncbi:TOG array regulator of axonemal microtubules protein 2-like [Lathamus discolor]|uniref:TOG array regulator of axonemal microtubules protein 2-like n=1 Tax=Lathamus discolor TaxID=678569 RepID=UPI0032B7483F